MGGTSKDHVRIAVNDFAARHFKRWENLTLMWLGQHQRDRNQKGAVEPWPRWTHRSTVQRTLRIRPERMRESPSYRLDPTDH